MKPIYSIHCPYSDRMVAISNLSYKKYPNSVKKNSLFQVWYNALRRDGLYPKFDILDAVDSSVLEDIYSMYLGQFRNWNLELFNFPEQKGIDPIKVLLNEPINPNEYLIDDLLEIKNNADWIFPSTKSHWLNNTELHLELINLLIYNMYTSIPWKRILRMKVSDREDRSEKFPYYLYSYSNNLRNLKKSKSQTFLFSRISKYPIENILHALNSIFLSTETRIILNLKVWNNLYYLVKYMEGRASKNPTIMIGDLFMELTSNKKNQVNDMKYQNKSAKLATLIENMASLNPTLRFP